MGVDHPILKRLPAFVGAVQKKLWKQGQALGIVPGERPGLPTRLFAMTWAVLLFLRSQFARSHSRLEKNYLSELGFTPETP
jgi:hypothetical protein